MFVIAGLGAALAYGVAMVLQQRGARTVPVEASLRAGLVVQLLRRRLWLLGVACNLAAFGLRGLALADGSLAVVQPVILLGLFVALTIESRLDRRVLGSTEVLGSLALIGGLVLFVLAADPGRGRPDALALDWLALGAVAGGAALLAVVWASRLAGEARAAGLALGGALLLALVSALTKAVAGSIAAGSAVAGNGLHVLGSWELYALVPVGVLAVVVTQSAFQAGPLRASLPVLSVVEPLTSILVGAWVFEEHLGTSVAARAGEVSGLLLLGLGTVLLTTRAAVGITASVPVDHVG